MIKGIKINVQYDTTFNLCDYYLSILSFVHPFIENAKGKPVSIPVFYYLHARKFDETHQTFWDFFEKKIGKEATKIFIVTDCESAIRNAIKRSLAKYDICLVRCWNHLSKTIERWLRCHNSASDVGNYVSAVRELMLQTTKENFDSVLIEKKTYWNENFIKYFDTHIMPDVSSIARYAIKESVGHHFDSISGIYILF